SAILRYRAAVAVLGEALAGASESRTCARKWQHWQRAVVRGPRSDTLEAHRAPQTGHDATACRTWAQLDVTERVRHCPTLERVDQDEVLRARPSTSSRRKEGQALL